MEPGFSPLDEELELLPGRLSPTLHNVVARLGAAMPFRQVQAIVQLVGRVPISVSTICRVTEQAGAALVAVEDAQVREIERGSLPWPTGAACLQISVDGAMVPVQGGVWQEAKTAAIGAFSRTHPGKTTDLSYVSRLQNVDRFSWLAIGELHRRGIFTADQVVAVVDGAPWCQTFLDYHLPHAVRILDFPHAVEHLSQAGQTCFGQFSQQATDWLEVQKHALRHADPQTVVAAVAALPVAHAADPAQAREVQRQVHAYLQARLPQMAYANFTAQGFPIGSGIVESANKLVVEARLKGAGMHWKAEHVDALLALRCAICSHTWDAVWPKLSRQRRQTSRRSHPRPSRPAPLSSPVSAQITTVTQRPPSTPRTPTIVNGKPTKDHPWKQSMVASRRPLASTIPKM